MCAEITIPSQLVPHAREAVTYMLRRAGADIMVQTERGDPDLGEPLERLDTYRALLEALPTKPNTAAHVGVEQGLTLREAIREHTSRQAGVMASSREEGRAAAWVRAAWIEEMGGELADLEAFTASLELIEKPLELDVAKAVEWQETERGLLARYGEWSARIEPRELKARPGESFWHWRFDHDGAGHIASGLCRLREGAVECVEAELRKWTETGRVSDGE
jgi:hypothetical protein